MFTICLVDDNPDILEVLSMLLSRDNFQVISASGGRQCCEMLRTQRADLILLDVTMKPVDGWQTLERLKTSPLTRGIPVIMLSGRNPTMGEIEKFGAYFVTYIRKPMEYRNLSTAIMYALEPARTRSPGIGVVQD